jgi:hypothetical protein
VPRTPFKVVLKTGWDQICPSNNLTKRAGNPYRSSFSRIEVVPFCLPLIQVSVTDAKRWLPLLTAGNCFSEFAFEKNPKRHKERTHYFLDNHYFDQRYKEPANFLTKKFFCFFRFVPLVGGPHLPSNLPCLPSGGSANPAPCPRCFITLVNGVKSQKKGLHP